MWIPKGIHQSNASSWYHFVRFPTQFFADENGTNVSEEYRCLRDVFFCAFPANECWILWNQALKKLAHTVYYRRLSWIYMKTVLFCQSTKSLPLLINAYASKINMHNLHWYVERLFHLLLIQTELQNTTHCNSLRLYYDIDFSDSFVASQA